MGCACGSPGRRSSRCSFSLTTAATLCAALFGGTGADWAGPGTGVQGAALRNKIAVIDEALARTDDAFREVRQTYGAD